MFPRSQALASLEKARRDRVRELTAEVADEFYVAASDVLSGSRRPLVVWAKHELMARLWSEGMSLSLIGRLLDMDHTSVRHGVRRVLGPEYAAQAAQR